jgi:hypothetical protein
MRSKDFARGVAAAAAVAGSLFFAERATGADCGYGGPSPDFVQVPQQDKVGFMGWFYTLYRGRRWRHLVADQAVGQLDHEQRFALPG